MKRNNTHEGLPGRWTKLGVVLALGLLILGMAASINRALAEHSIPSNWDWHWHDEESFYKIHPTLIPDDWRDEIHDSAIEWNSNTRTAAYSYELLPQETIWKANIPDEGQCVSGMLACTDRYLDVENEDHMTDAWTIFNQSEDFNVDCTSSDYHVFSVMLHEFGHYAGYLDHTFDSQENPRPVMYLAIGKSTCYSGLTQDDIDSMDTYYANQHD